MQKILGYMRKAIGEFDMLSDGDRVCVAVSGGKDSLVMLVGLVLLRRFIGIDYDITAVTADPKFGGKAGDYSGVAALCESYGVPYHIIETDIAQIVFDIRKEKNPCSLCARMRRGALHNAAVDLGCNKIALGHNFDDVIETFLMNLFIEGRIGCFSPVNYLSRKKITVIRPLVLAPEKDIRKAARVNGLAVVRSQCPADGNTERQKMKEFIAERERLDRGFRDRIFGALRRSDIDGWGGATYGNK